MLLFLQNTQRAADSAARVKSVKGNWWGGSAFAGATAAAVNPGTKGWSYDYTYLQSTVRRRGGGGEVPWCPLTARPAQRGVVVRRVPSALAPTAPHPTPPHQFDPDAATMGAASLGAAGDTGEGPVSAEDPAFESGGAGGASDPASASSATLDAAAYPAANATVAAPPGATLSAAAAAGVRVHGRQVWGGVRMGAGDGGAQVCPTPSPNPLPLAGLPAPLASDQAALLPSPWTPG